MAELMAGRWQSGLALIDEAAAAASSGRLDLRVASDIYCNTIAACRNLGDLQRAAQWTEEAERWMRRQSVGGYPGICQVHRAELKMLRGQWPEAEQEARQACTELERYGLMDAVGFAQYQVGDIRLRMGDLDAAAEAFDRAYEFGHDAMPGLALLQLARGEVAEAQRSIARALAAASGTGAFSDRATRGRLLPAQVDIALAAHDLHDRRPCGRGARIDRGRLRTAAVPGGRADGPWRAPPRGGQADGGVADPGPVVAIVADDRPAVRECPGAPALRRGVGGRGRCGDRPARSAGRPRRVRAAGRDARPSAGRCPARRGGWAAGAAESLRPAGDEDVHVHRHRHLHRPGRRHRRRSLERAPGLARPRAALRGRAAPRRGGQQHRRRLLRGVRTTRPTRSTVPSTSSAGSYATAASTASRRRSGSGFTWPRRPAGVAITPGRACMSPLALAPLRDGRRSSRRAPSWPSPPRPASTLSEPRMLTLKGVREPVEVRTVDWR